MWGSSANINPISIKKLFPCVAFIHQYISFVHYLCVILPSWTCTHWTDKHFSAFHLVLYCLDCGISVLEPWIPPALPSTATLVTLSFVIHGWMVGVCVFSSTCCVGHITAAALNSGLITSHFTHLTSSPAPHNLLFPSIPSWLCFGS